MKKLIALLAFTLCVSAKANSGSIISNSATLTVSSPALVSIAITPGSVSVPAGTPWQFTATGTYTDGTTGDLTGSATWSSSDNTVATVSAGLASSLKQGSTTVTASLGSIAGNSGTLTVTAPVLVSITVTAPGNPNSIIAAGTTQQFKATGTYSDGSTNDLTSSATWTSSTGAANISSTGLATGVSVGSTTITATFGSASGAATLSVTPAALLSIVITPSNPSLPTGETQQFVATGTFSDNSTQDLTNSVIWSSSDNTVATVTNQGLATGVATGSVTMTATDSVSSIGNTATLTVLPAMISSIAVTPANPTIALGTTRQFIATATFSNGGTQDVTSVVTWSSSAMGVATINSSGLATSASQGSTTISATSSNSVVGSTILNVAAAALVSIAVTPGNSTIPLGTTQQFFATGTYTDNSTQLITTSVHWSSSTSTVATISDATGTEGLATSQPNGNQGATTITASDNATGISGSTALSVGPVTLASIVLTPSNASVALGTSQQYTAKGIFSDGTQQDLTRSPLTTWSAKSNTTCAGSAGQVATISSGGLAQATCVGTTTIAVANGSVNGSTGLTVTPAVLTAISVSPASASIQVGATQQFTATGTFTDNSTQDLTTSVVWGSSAASAATISNDPATAGLATGLASGTTSVTATSNSITGSASLTVTGP